MKILKCRPDIPDTMSYLDVVKKYQNWNNLKLYITKDEFMEVNPDNQYFINSLRGSHTDLCINCKDEIDNDCDITKLQTEFFNKKNTERKDNIGTLKKCPAIIDLFNTGIVIPAWTDMSFEAVIVNNDPNKRTILAVDKDKQPLATIHTTPQVDFKKMFFNVSHNFSIKFALPYRIFSKHLIMHKSIFWLGDAPFRVVEGIQDTNGLSSINLNTIWNLQDGQKWEIEKGYPLFWIMEIPKETVNQKHEIIQYEDINWDKAKKILLKDSNVHKANGYRTNIKKL